MTKRILTALVLLPFAIALFFYFNLNYFSATVAVIIYLGAIEWAKLAGIKSQNQQTIYATVLSLVNVGLLLLTPWSNTISWFFISETASQVYSVVLHLAILGILLGIIIVWIYSTPQKWWTRFALRPILGFIMLPGFLIALIGIRSRAFDIDFNYGSQLLLMMFCMVWAADIGAYFTGKIFGKHKLAPVVSPNKTWQGAFGGVIFSVGAAFLGMELIGLSVDNIYLFAVVSFLIAVISVYGDLFESALKRHEGIKDSSNLLPGHGGILDRLDSSIFVAPVFFLSFSWFGWI
ncbi:MAG: phosphatidate cytidylyltransferase [Gammaproteobacteria bacterium]|nr:phosphatidate cytidylyltransferase [Gammaproteobacteria bacterium]MDH5628530.1 phosphatidate cytidylyltransferase [Gammaproteobacteria bacterium]